MFPFCVIVCVFGAIASSVLHVLLIVLLQSCRVCESGTATAELPGPSVGSSFPAVCLASFVSMVSIRALRFVLEFVGEKHMRNWLTAHVRLGRLSWQGSEVFPPGEAAELNARLENLEDEVRVQREQQEEDDQTMAGLQWLIDHQDLFDQPDDV